MGPDADNAAVGICESCGAHLRATDRFCVVCDSPNMGGKLKPRFRSSLDDLEIVDPEPAAPELPVGTPLCPRCGDPDLVGVEYCRSCGMSMAKAHRFGVDGQVDGVWVTAVNGRPTYKPVRRRSIVFRAVLMLAMVVSGIAGLIHIAYYAGLDTLLPALPVENATWSDWIDRLGVEIIGILVVVCLVATWWTSRAYRNLVPMRVSGLRIPVTLARVAWLIPFANLWLSKIVTDDIWKASDPATGVRSSNWRKRPASMASNVGWTAGIGALLLIPWSAVSMPDVAVGREGQLRAALMMGAAGYGLLVLALAVLAVLVEQITDRQAARVARLGTSPRPLPLQHADPELLDAKTREDADEAAEAAKSGRLTRRSESGESVWGSY